jgi:hypothetical protein
MAGGSINDRKMRPMSGKIFIAMTQTLLFTVWITKGVATIDALRF